MGAIRMNITLPEKTAKKLKKNIKPRERSQVIADALEVYFRQGEKEKLMRELINDYMTSAHLEPEDTEWLESNLTEDYD